MAGAEPEDPAREAKFRLAAAGAWETLDNAAEWATRLGELVEKNDLWGMAQMLRDGADRAEAFGDDLVASGNMDAAAKMLAIASEQRAAADLLEDTAVLEGES